MPVKLTGLSSITGLFLSSPIKVTALIIKILCLRNNGFSQNKGWMLLGCTLMLNVYKIYQEINIFQKNETGRLS